VSNQSEHKSIYRFKYYYIRALRHKHEITYNYTKITQVPKRKTTKKHSSRWSEYGRSLHYGYPNDFCFKCMIICLLMLLGESFGAWWCDFWSGTELFPTSYSLKMVMIALGLGLVNKYWSVGKFYHLFALLHHISLMSPIYSK